MLVSRRVLKHSLKTSNSHLCHQAWKKTSYLHSSCYVAFFGRVLCFTYIYHISLIYVSVCIYTVYISYIHHHQNAFCFPFIRWMPSLPGLCAQMPRKKGAATCEVGKGGVTPTEVWIRMKRQMISWGIWIFPVVASDEICFCCIFFCDIFMNGHILCPL